MLKQSISAAMTAAALLVTPAAITPAQDWGDASPVYRAAVDRLGNHQYQCFREPVVIKTRSGVLILTVQAGNRLSWPERSGQDLVVRTSVDNGRTWSKLILAAEAGNFHCQCHGLVHDAERGRTFLLYTTYNWDYTVIGEARGAKATGPLHREMKAVGHPFRTSCCVYSDDDGASWSKPRDITKQVGMQAHFGSSEGRQLTLGKHKGRLLLAGALLENSDLGRPTRKHPGVWHSDDHGVSWQLAKVRMPDGTNTARNCSSEARVTELADGTLLYNQRTRNTGRHLAWSKDGGDTWTTTQQAEQLEVTQCNGCTLTLRDENGRLTDTVLFSIPSPGGRSTGLIYVSHDGGHTWPIAKQMTTGYFAYSALIQMDADHVALFFEANHYQDIRLLTVAVKKLITGR